MCKECHGVEFIANGDKMFYNSFDELTDDLKDKFKSKAKGVNLQNSKNGYVGIINELNKNGDILLSSFVNQNTKLKIKRKECGHTTDVKFCNYKRQGCGLCNGHTKEFGKINFLKKLKENKDELIGEYVDSKTHVTIRWHECGHITKITPNNYMRDRGCGICWKDILKSGDIIRDKWANDEEFRKRITEATKEWWDTEDGSRQRDIFRDKMKELNDILWDNEEFIQMQRDKMKEKSTRLWSDEEYRNRMSGENASNWKGGITPIKEYLRRLSIVNDWRVRAFIEADKRCEISGKKVKSNTGEVHHIKPFVEIVREAHTLNNIEIKQIVSDYSKEDLEILKDYVKEWHKDTTNAIVLHKEIHQYFHDVFMKGKGRESSVEDVEEFKQRYLNGEFDDLLGDDLDG